jgi:hypothetical protein
VREAKTNPPAVAMMPPMMNQKLLIVKFERLITNCVGAGSAWPKLLKRSAKTGIT